MKLGWILFFALNFGALSTSAQSDQVEAFIGEGTSDVLIDLEGETPATFQVIDELSEREKMLEEAIRIPPKPSTPRVIVPAAPYMAQLVKGSILTTLDGKKKLRTKSNIIVKAQEVIPGGQKAWILTKDGEKKYFTDTVNAPNINHVVQIEPTINPLKVYTDKPAYGSRDKETNFSHFFSFHLESIRTNYFKTIFRGEKGSASATTLQSKNYLISKRFPFHVGFNISTQFGYWEDPVLGTMTWNGFFFGPSIMRTFWEKEDGRWNLHFSAFRSLIHESEKSPDRHSYSTLGLQGDLEKEFDTTLGPLTLGLSYRWSRSSIKETTEYLENEAIKGEVVSVGAYLSYRFNWTL